MSYDIVEREGGEGMKILFINLHYHGHVIPTIQEEIANAPGNWGAVKIVEAYGENNDNSNRTFNFKK